MLSKTKIALSAAVVLSATFPTWAATKHHHRVTYARPQMYDAVPDHNSGDCSPVHPHFAVTFAQGLAHVHRQIATEFQCRLLGVKRTWSNANRTAAAHGNVSGLPQTKSQRLLSGKISGGVLAGFPERDQLVAMFFPIGAHLVADEVRQSSP